MSDQTNEDKPALTLKEVKAMSRDEINARWDEVQAALSRTPSTESEDDDDA